MAEEVEQWDVEVLQEDKTVPPVITYRMRIRAQVAVPKGRPDPAFKLEAKLNKQVFTSGEEIVVEARASGGRFITLINLTADSRALVLVPSRVRQRNSVAPSDKFRFPERSEQAAGIHLKVGTLSGHRTDREAIVVVATKTYEPLPLQIEERGELCAGDHRALVGRYSPFRAEYQGVALSGSGQLGRLI